MLSQPEQDAFSKAFAANVIAQDRELAAKVDPKPIFCEYWSYCKMALEAASALVSNIIVKGAIKTVIAAGDALHSTICGK